MNQDSTVPTSIEGVSSTIQDTLFTIWSNFIAHVPYLAGAIAVLFFTWLATVAISRFGERLFSKSRLRQSLQELIIRLIVIGVWIFGFLLAAMIVFPGLTPAKALGGLGLMSVAVGFAFKDIFENFFAGILLLWRYPFENGDYIECDGVEGKIERTEIRLTKIRKTNGELVVVPNSHLFKNPVRVLTDQNKRRVTITTGVAYSENLDESIDVISRAVERCETVEKQKPVQVFPSAFGSSSIDIEVTWWTDAKPLDVRRSTGEVITVVKKALDDAGIEIPFPYRTLTFSEPLELAGKAQES